MSLPRIILADDHRLFAEGLRALLQEDFNVVTIVEDGQALLEAVEQYAPDLVVADVSMPRLNGIECVRKLKASFPKLKIILLTMHEEVNLATTALKSGASGYLLKNGGTGDVLKAVRMALIGGKHISPQLSSEVHKALQSGRSKKQDLTPRQVEILRLLIAGLSAKEIATKLSLSPRTVEHHKYQAMERVGVSTSAELITYGMKHGIGPL